MSLPLVLLRYLCNAGEQHEGCKIVSNTMIKYFDGKYSQIIFRNNTELLACLLNASTVK